MLLCLEFGFSGNEFLAVGFEPCSIQFNENCGLFYFAAFVCSDAHHQAAAFERNLRLARWLQPADKIAFNVVVIRAFHFCRWDNSGSLASVLVVFSARECNAKFPSVVVPTTNATARLTSTALLIEPSQLPWVSVSFAVSVVATLLAFSQKLVAEVPIAAVRYVFSIPHKS